MSHPVKQLQTIPVFFELRASKKMKPFKEQTDRKLAIGGESRGFWHLHKIWEQPNKPEKKSRSAVKVWLIWMGRGRLWKSIVTKHSSDPQSTNHQTTSEGPDVSRPERTFTVHNFQEIKDISSTKYVNHSKQKKNRSGTCYMCVIRYGIKNIFMTYSCWWLRPEGLLWSQTRCPYTCPADQRTKQQVLWVSEQIQV